MHDPTKNPPSSEPGDPAGERRFAAGDDRMRGVDRAALVRVVTPIVLAHGGELYDVEWKSERGGWVLRVLVEKAGAAEQRLSTRDAAVDLEMCSDVSRDLSTALDVADLFPHAYHLEVGTPGVERALRGESDLRRFAGEKARFKLREGVSGQKVVVGIVGPVEGGRLKVQDGGRTFELALDDIESARLVFEFGKKSPPPSHGKPAKKRH